MASDTDPQDMNSANMAVIGLMETENIVIESGMIDAMVNETEIAMVGEVAGKTLRKSGHGMMMIAAVTEGEEKKTDMGAEAEADEDMVEVEVVAEQEEQEERRMVAEGGEDGNAMGWVRLRGDHLPQWTPCL